MTLCNEGLFLREKPLAKASTTAMGSSPER